MQTPLHISCRKGLVAMTTYLLLKQAETDVIDGSGNTPANVARKYGHRQIEELILRAVACRTSTSVHPTPFSPDENIRIETSYERTFTTQLILACFQNDTKKASCLISHGANINARDVSLNTALHYASATGNQKLVKLLLENKANPNALNMERNNKKRPPSWISIFGRNFGVDQHFCAKFGTVMENRQPKGFHCSEVGFSKIQDGGRPPSWISIFGHNFGVDQHFCTKFCTKMENGQPNGSQCSEIRFSKIQDGGRPPSWISILGRNFGVAQHYCAKFGTVMENR